MKSVHIMTIAAAAMSVTVAFPLQARAQCYYGCGGLVGGLVGGVIGGAIAGSAAAQAQQAQQAQQPVVVIHERRVVRAKRSAPPRQQAARSRGNGAAPQKASINTSADPFAGSKSSASAEPTPVSAKQ